MKSDRRSKERRGYQQQSQGYDDDVGGSTAVVPPSPHDDDPEAQQQQQHGDGPDDDAERRPITAGGRTQEWGTTTGTGIDTGSRWRSSLVLSLCILLAADVSLRLFGRRTSRTSSLTSARWVPTVDILNASTSGVTDLKYLDDIDDNGLQGLAISSDGRILYEFHTMAVRVMQLDDATGSTVIGVTKRRVYDGSVDFPPLIDDDGGSLEVRHVGGIDLAQSDEHGTEIWIATHSDGIDGRGALFAVDPDTLDVKTSRSVQVPYNLDWVAYRDGVLYYGVFFNVKLIHRVLLSTLQPLPDLELSLPEHLREGGINYVQSAAFDLDGRLVLLGDDYQCTVYYIDVGSGAVLGTQALLLGSEVDGITFDRTRRTMLVGFNRQHSHEQVMQMEPMVSVIKLELR
mmetsp:Transcript_6593/g.14460  ORF Transcript_6593/g.14460 Transcript_6593/m.14460 type:complete len:400 (+) Transcript_6593:115-1314(+)|eukprot:CAMPEP_0178522368 /NCGR_PEP_ID=MMETSP0696-20121128/28497_1 /TAXON_ID=265572 /ORGANISM="Extubocellulus spinifer, Strain CCMP396" /LENGTH=399 /DNA_ID=CAMNT_0020153481 /DNA_START=34 /DNA_END=1233 /DNA_ORIENTATION=-